MHDGKSVSLDDQQSGLVANRCGLLSDEFSRQVVIKISGAHSGLIAVHEAVVENNSPKTSAGR